MGTTDTKLPVMLGRGVYRHIYGHRFVPHLSTHVTAASSRARRRAFGNTSISIGTDLTPERFSRARSLRTCPGGISRNRLQPSSCSTTVDSYQRTPCAILFARSLTIASLVCNARAFTFATYVICGALRFREEIRCARKSATGWSNGQCDGTET